MCVLLMSELGPRLIISRKRKCQTKRHSTGNGKDPEEPTEFSLSLIVAFLGKRVSLFHLNPPLSCEENVLLRHGKGFGTAERRSLQILQRKCTWVLLWGIQPIASFGTITKSLSFFEVENHANFKPLGHFPGFAPHNVQACYLTREMARETGYSRLNF